MTDNTPDDPKKAQPLEHRNSSRALVLAALYDFAARLTTRPGTMHVGSSHDTCPMVEALKEFIGLRHLEIGNYFDPPIKDWRERLGQRELVELMVVEAPCSDELGFGDELGKLLNRFGMDSYAGTPDHVLVKMVGAYLDSLHIRTVLVKDDTASGMTVDQEGLHRP